MNRRLLAVVALAAGVLAAFAGSPYSGRRVVESSSGRGETGETDDRARKTGKEERPLDDSTTRRLDDSIPPATRALVQQLAATVAREEDHVTALELAAWIRDRKPGLRVIDLRTEAEFRKFHLPRAEWIPLQSIATTSFRQDETIVLLSEGGAHAAQAWVFLRSLGHREVYFLRGGVGEWIAEVQNPSKPTPLTRYFGRRGC